MGRELTRRELIQAGMASLSLLVIGPPASDKEPPFLGDGGPSREVSLYTGRDFSSVATTCGMCPAGCGIVVFVDGSDVVGIKGNPGHPYNRGRICALGSAGVNLLNDPQRILRPLRRVGSRGEGRWKEISWEDALGEIAARLKRISPEESRAGRCAFMAPHGEASPFLGRFVDAVGESCVLIESGGLETTVDEEAHRQVWGSGVGMADYAHAHVIVNFGANLLASPRQLVGFSQRWIQARKDHGVWLATFDPQCSTTASASHEWIPLKPGTDGLVALAMAKIILDDRVEDREFLARHADGDPERLREALAALDAKRIASISGIPLSTIQRLAHRFAGAGRGVAVYGSGVTGHEQGVWNAQSVLLLNLITGNVERKGGYCVSRAYTLDDLSPRPPARHTANLPGTLFWDLEHGHQEVDILFTFQANPAYEDPEPRRTAEILKSEQRIPFHVAMDSTMSETVMLADLVLPACTYLERWGVSSGQSMEQVPYISVQQPVVEPLGQSRAPEDVLIELARHLGPGVERYFPFQRARDYYEGVVRNIKELESQGGWPLVTHKGFWVADGGEGLWGRDQTSRFPLQGNKCRLLPVITRGISETQASSFDSHPPEEKTLLLFSVPVHGTGTAGCKWLSEIDHAAPVWIHPRAADELGLREGDRVRLISSVGEIRARVRLTQGINPGAVAMEDTGGHDGFGPLARGVAYRSDDPDSMLVWWAKEVYGENPRALIAWSKDPHSLGPRWMDTVVRIEKA